MSEQPRYRRHWIDRMPKVAWEVGGRKMFDDRVPPKIRAMWKVGRYPIGPSAPPRPAEEP